MQCVDSLIACYSEMDAWDQRTSPRRFALSGKRHLLLLVRLNEETNDDAMWNLYPKHHLLIHVVENSMVNPRLEWNYGEESTIGDAVAMSKNCFRR